MKSKPAPLRPFSRLALSGLALATGSAPAALLSALGHRMGWWSVGVALALFVLSLLVALGGVVVSALGAVRTRPSGSFRGLPLALLGVVIGLAVLAVPGSRLLEAARLPAINDITTDFADPPQFVAILPLRAGSSVPAKYPGAATAVKQRRAYPELYPAFFSDPPARVFQAAQAVARDLGWHIVASVPAEGRLEATDTTFWFGFTDDIVVRVRPEGPGARVDVRSVSRAGRGDLGTNAARIARFLKRLKAQGLHPL